MYEVTITENGIRKTNEKLRAVWDERFDDAVAIDAMRAIASRTISMLQASSPHLLERMRFMGKARIILGVTSDTSRVVGVGPAIPGTMVPTFVFGAIFKDYMAFGAVLDWPMLDIANRIREEGYVDAADHAVCVAVGFIPNIQHNVAPRDKLDTTIMVSRCEVLERSCSNDCALTARKNYMASLNL